MFDPTRITADERRSRYQKHRLLRDAALVDDAAAMAEVLREHLSANEEHIREHIRMLANG